MPILTLTTDWGHKDQYLAAFKGLLLSRIPDLTMVDVSHSIDKHNIIQAAFILGNAYTYFPEGTIHFLGLLGSDDAHIKNPYVIVKAHKNFFVGHDSGIFSLLLGASDKKIVRLPISTKQHLKNIQLEMVNSIAKLVSNEYDFDSAPDDRVFELYDAQPTITQHHLGASVIYIDSFGNAILNVKKELLDKELRGRNFKLHFYKADLKLDGVKLNYDDVDTGEALLMMNQNDYLQISINRGSASQLLGIKLNDQVRFEFED